MILVTGGTGFIGSNIVAALATRGAKLAVCDRHFDDSRAGNIAGREIAHQIEADDLMPWLQGRDDIDAVVHMGAISATTETDADLILRTNVWLSLELWDWCAAHDVPLIYASSAQVYGDGSLGFDDDPSQEAMAQLRAITPYGASKLLFDRLVARQRDAGLAAPPQWAGLRFFNVYGPQEGHKGDMRSVIAKTFPALQSGQAMRLFRSDRDDYGDGGQMRDFIHVRDCAEVVCWLLDNPGVNGFFNLGTGQARTWLDLAHAMFAALGREPEIEFFEMPEELKGRYQYFTQAEMMRLRQAGYDRDFTSLEDGVADYINGYLLR
ncbi:MAG: ADP-glyceromanno-heptose 6-epimerase [Alphaproteobacteria bacterium]|nr:ADP-glyceromanno-heptose 6-epimerase [Rhodospirillaceae bacterium]MBT6202652.1 ADP-glyceromanno-heptose 6-epimerase [Rhodospirillaceae bacterium]MBT7648985.1 ADP-glyceromanno-heptose 6-epimerase [Rhodospirillaceae bacterium]MDG2481546.1 ADP-glyceromanno-heptose 6-epimerase [Alphaproteobacteria bacterium]